MFRIRYLTLALGLFSAPAFSGENHLTLPLDYGLIRSTLVNQLYTGEGETVRAWQDGKQCSFLDLSHPRISGQDGQVKMLNDLHARFGAKMGGKCMTLVEWSGLLQTLQKPTLEDNGSVVSLPITSAEAIDNKGQAVNIAQLQDLIKQVAAPKLSDLKLDLNKVRGDIVKTLLPYVAAQDSERLNDTVNSLRFNTVEADKKGLQIDIGFNTGAAPDNAAQELPLTGDELQQWRGRWQAWEGDLQTALQKAPTQPELAKHKGTLQKILKNAGGAFEKGLTAENLDKDPVRQFFNSSWDEMGPLLRTASEQLPGAENLRYLTLIAATDLLYQVEGVTSPFGLDISANSLRKLARRVISQPNTP